VRLTELIAIMDEQEHMDAYVRVWCVVTRAVTGNGSRNARLCMAGMLYLACAGGCHENR